MILLDTHIWIWWVQGDSRLTEGQLAHLTANEKSGLVVSAISCWEVGMLVRKGRLQLSLPIERWVNQALAYPGVVSVPIIAETAVASHTLPGTFHADPADRLIVATSRINSWPLLTADRRILAYPHVTCLS